MTRALLIATATLALAAAGCGGDDATDAGGGSSGGAPATRTTADGALRIGMKDLSFSPAEATVKVGQKVTWVDDESIPHNVVSDDGQLKSDTFGEDGSYSFTPKKPGTIDYVCTLHPGMEGKLKVE